MNDEDTLGPQCADDDAFLARARRHQSRFRVDVLGVAAWRDYGSRLPTAAALAGKNFYPWPGMIDAVEQRFGVADKKLCWDLLASDNIPFNFFVPLRDLAMTKDLVRQWTDDDVTRIERIEVEWAPKPRARYLDDSTSFDACVRYVRAGGGRGLVGVETKFTEGPYAWGATEQQQMFAPGSRYLVVSQAADLYVDGALTQLRTPKLKQLWRNQLLGEALVQRGEIERFTSVLLFPADNRHYATAAQAHQQLLQPEARHRFAAVTFEDHFARCDALANDDDTRVWLAWLRRRYIVA